MNKLPEPWNTAYEESGEAIKARLGLFSAIKKEEYFYELVYCILTPQSSAKNASQAVAKLQAQRFLEQGFDPTDILRDPTHYIRFHNTKAKRLLTIREEFPVIAAMIEAHQNDIQLLRNEIRSAINGFGLKESSHFLRNIGFLGFGILDRHIFKHLYRLGVITDIPTSMSEKKYIEIEEAWKKFSEHIGISIDELDLLFWSMETGVILK